MTEHSDLAKRGIQAFEEILGWPAPEPKTPFGEAARDFAFGSVWARGGLDRLARRWITLTCVCAAGVEVPIRTYLSAALDCGEISEGELREFILQFAAYQGFPRAARIEIMLTEILEARASKQG